MGPLINLCSPFPSLWFCSSLFFFFLASFSGLLFALLFIPHPPPLPATSSTHFSQPLTFLILRFLFLLSACPFSFSLLCMCMSPPSGEIVLWDLTRTGKSKWTLFGTSSDSQSHNRIVFNMSSVLLQGERELLISTSMDREVRSASVALIRDVDGKFYR